MKITLQQLSGKVSIEQLALRRPSVELSSPVTTSSYRPFPLQTPSGTSVIADHDATAAPQNSAICSLYTIGRLWHSDL